MQGKLMKWLAVIMALCLAGCAGGSAQQNPNPTSTSITGVSVSATADSACLPTVASANLHALHRRIEAEALAHARQALGKPSLPIQLDLV